MHICHVVFSEGWGGAETVVHELSRHLVDKGEKVSIILNNEILEYYNDLEDVQLFSIGPLYDLLALSRCIIYPTASASGKYKRYNSRMLMAIRLYFMELLTYVYYKRSRKQIMRFLSDSHVDIIHSHMVNAALFVSELGDIKIPTVTTPHGEHFFGGNIRVHPLVRPLIQWKARGFKKALTEVNKVVEVSAYMVDEYERRGILLKSKSAVVYNGIPISDIQTSSESTLTLEGGFNLLFPGGAKALKGGDLLIECLPIVKMEIPDIHLYIALDVPKNHMLRKTVKRLGLEDNVTFVGFLPPQEYLRLLKSVDMLVMPSRYEAFAIACLEAMALGKPIVASNIGGIPEVLKNRRNGILVELDPNQIAEAIIYLYRHEDVQREIGQNNLQDVVRFDWRYIIDQYIEIYRRLCEEKTICESPLC